VRVHVRSVPTADERIESADAWWRANRPSAPDLFAQELRAARELLSNSPEVGLRRWHKMIPGLRRLLLPKSRYHVYYAHNARREEVLILAVWSAVRGRGPRLDRPTP